MATVVQRIGDVLELDDLDRIDTIITNLLDNRDLYVKEIVNARNEYVYNFGHSSRTGAEFINRFLKGNL